MDRFEELKVRIFDRFIDKFAERYVQQRSAVPVSVLEQAAALDCGLDTESLMKVIRSTSCYVDPDREAGHRPPVLNDIYRSDLGELLTTYYFEEKLPEGDRYVIPLKNITYRELPQTAVIRFCCRKPRCLTRSAIPLRSSMTQLILSTRRRRCTTTTCPLCCKG